MLTLWRRHTKECKVREEGRKATHKCDCPVWIDGEVFGKRIRCSTGTRDWARASRRASDFESAAEDRRGRKQVPEAAAAFLASFDSAATSTMKRYRRIAGVVVRFAAASDITWVDEFTLEKLDGLRATRKIGVLTWSKELEVIRQIFRFWVDRKWITENPALKLRRPKDPQPADERNPYTVEELEQIFRAADTFGRGPYERKRARAMLTLMFYYGPRISDVALLRKSSILLGGPTGDSIMFRTYKTSKPIWLPLYPEVKQVLDDLPLPRRAGRDCPYYFWHGFGDPESFTKTAGMTLLAVFRKSGVDKGKSHRFRHTLVNKILTNGGSLVDAAEILGDTPEIIRKHYKQWSPETQARTAEVLDRVHGTILERGKTNP